MSDPYDFFAQPRAAAPTDGSTPSPSAPPMGGAPTRFGGTPAGGYGTPASGYGTPASGFGAPAPGFGAAPPGYGTPQGPGGYPGLPHGRSMRRPGAVTAVAVLIFIGAGLLTLASVVMFALLALVDSNDPESLGAFFDIDRIALIGGFVLAFFAALYILAGRFLLKGNYVVMWVVTVIHAFSIVATVFDVATGGTVAGAGLNVAISALILWLLWNPQSKAWFAAQR